MGKGLGGRCNAHGDLFARFSPRAWGQLNGQQPKEPDLLGKKNLNPSSKAKGTVKNWNFTMKLAY